MGGTQSPAHAFEGCVMALILYLSVPPLLPWYSALPETQHSGDSWPWTEDFNCNIRNNFFFFNSGNHYSNRNWTHYPSPWVPSHQWAVFRKQPFRKRKFYSQIALDLSWPNPSWGPKSACQLTLPVFNMLTVQIVWTKSCIVRVYVQMCVNTHVCKYFLPNVFYHWTFWQDGRSCLRKSQDENFPLQLKEENSAEALKIWEPRVMYSPQETPVVPFPQPSCTAWFDLNLCSSEP